MREIRRQLLETQRILLAASTPASSSLAGREAFYEEIRARIVREIMALEDDLAATEGAGADGRVRGEGTEKANTPAG